MQIQLSDHFTYKKLLRFTAPSMIMMVFTSFYTIVDGFFISNFAGKIAFTAINLIYPLLMILGTFGFMIGTGGSAIVGFTLGEGKRDLANCYFSMLVYATLAIGSILAFLGFISLPWAAVLLGARGKVVEECVLYGRILLLAMPFFLLQNVFQSFFVTAERPKIGLAVSVAAGMTNILLDALFVGGFRWGLAGAAAATALSQFMGGIIPLLYFSMNNASSLQLGRCLYKGSVLLKACTNGSSEFLSNVAISIVTMLYNFQLLRIVGEDGVAAYGVIAYIGFIFTSIFFGYNIGGAPLISYHYGAGNHKEMHNLYKKSLTLMGVGGFAMTVFALVFAPGIVKIFVGYDRDLYELTVHGCRFFVTAFVLSGTNIFASAFFTALNDGLISAILSFLRTLVFQVVCVVTLPLLLGLDGIWLSFAGAEIMAFLVSVYFLLSKKKKYAY